MKNKLIQNIFIATVFGFGYGLLEVIYRCHTHWSMILLGGICGITIGLLNEYYPKLRLVQQMLLGSIIITVLEFIFGFILNITLGLNVWDYSNVPFNLYGQICLPFSVLWFFLSFVVIIVDDFIRDKKKN